MRLEIPDDILQRAEANAADLYVALAVQLYAENRIDHEDACRLSGLSPAAFSHEALLRALSIQQYPHALGASRRREAG